MKRALIILASVAVLLGIVTFFVVFYSGGTYVVSSPLPSNSSFVSSTAELAQASSTTGSSTSTASSTLNGNASSTSSSTFQEYASSYSVPPITWIEGNETLGITSATLSGSQLTLGISVAMGAVSECVPMNVRLVADENGDLTPPLTTQFSFPDSGTCVGTPGATYSDQEIVFTVDPTTLPLLLTTGGTSNSYFEVATDTTGGLDITPPPTSG